MQQNAGRNYAMEDFGFLEMQRMQAELQEKYKDQWERNAERGHGMNLFLAIPLQDGL